MQMRSGSMRIEVIGGTVEVDPLLAPDDAPPDPPKLLDPSPLELAPLLVPSSNALSPSLLPHAPLSAATAAVATAAIRTKVRILRS